MIWDWDAPFFPSLFLFSSCHTVNRTPSIFFVTMYCAVVGPKATGPCEYRKQSTEVNLSSDEAGCLRHFGMVCVWGEDATIRTSTKEYIQNNINSAASVCRVNQVQIKKKLEKESPCICPKCYLPNNKNVRAAWLTLALL